MLEIGAGQPYVADAAGPARLRGLGRRSVRRLREWTEWSSSGTARRARRCASSAAAFGDELAAIEPRTSTASTRSPCSSTSTATASTRSRAACGRHSSPSGVSIHAVDHVHRGRGAEEHLERLHAIVERFGGSSGELDETLARLSGDTETYYLSAESHNRWRGDTPYDEFPMRVCVGVSVVSKRDELRPR